MVNYPKIHSLCPGHLLVSMIVVYDRPLENKAHTAGQDSSFLAPIRDLSETKDFNLGQITHCWVYVMSISQSEDMNSKCHISYIF